MLSLVTLLHFIGEFYDFIFDFIVPREKSKIKMSLL